MTEGLLRNRLAPVASRRRHLRFWKRLTVGWGVAAVIALVVYLIQRLMGFASPLTLPLVAIIGFVTAIVIALKGIVEAGDLRAAAATVEEQHPELDGLLLTAVQQTAQPNAPLGYLQRCLLRDAVAHSRKHSWPAAIPNSRIARAQFAQAGTLILFLVSLWFLKAPGDLFHSPLVVRTSGVSVTPGDVALERGESLVVLARFGGAPPANAELVIGNTPATERRIPLTRSLSDPVFGGTVPEVTQDLVYRVEYRGERTRDFKVTVFEHPRLERADVELTYPEYTRQEPRRIENTRRVTAVEGSRLDLALQLNKPVRSAVLTSRNPELPDVPLVVAENSASAQLADFALEHRATYELRLLDDEGRTNKVPSQFVFEVLPNRTPELRLLAPRGDVRPSPIEEVLFNGTVWDDFGVVAHGIGFNLVDREPIILELGTNLPASQRHAFEHILALENLRVEPDQLVSWYLWADDIGPDGNVRRTEGDLLFAEIRPFEEVFREGAGMQEQQGGQMPGGEGNENQQLVRLQKQIVSATWKLQRDSKTNSPRYKEDVGVVRDSQSHAIELAEEAAGRSGGRMRPLWDAVIEDMSTAVVRLGDALDSVSALSGALAAEQAAYQGLLKLQGRETEVTRGRGGGGGGGGASQRQLDQLELSQAEDRYETQRQAQAPQSPERREQLQVLSRLQELARRQQDLNERLKELQTALQEAQTQEQREELRRQLKRLEEEQQQMLADLDELEQRTQRPENQARMSELRQQLQQTREDMQRAGEAAREGEVSQALAAGTRAQRQLQTLRDEIRQESASEFAEDLRNMRAEARQLEREQESILGELASENAGQRRTLGSPERPEGLVERLEEQQRRLTNLVDRATQISQAAEPSEPLVAEHLYEMLRQLHQEEALNVQQLQQELIERGRMTRALYERLQSEAGLNRVKSLEAATELLRDGFEAEAAEAGERAQASISSIRQGIERAAESVLGDDTAALQLARDELEALANQLEEEIRRASGSDQQASANTGQSQQQEGALGPGDDPAQSQSSQSRGRGGGQAEDQQGGDQQGGGQQEGEGGSQSANAQDRQGQGGGQQQGDQQGSQQGSSPGQGGGNADGSQEGGTPQQGTPQDGQQGGGRGEGPQLAQGGNQARGEGGDAGGRSRNDSTTDGPGGRGGFNLDDLLGGGGTDGGWTGGGPITTEEAFGPWSDRLREVEQLIDMPELRSEVATARERARLTRRQYRQDLKKPDWAVVRLEILGPLVEVRRELDAELIRRTADDPLLPIDRDPVPTRFSELVRRYYEELGKDR